MSYHPIYYSPWGKYTQFFRLELNPRAQSFIVGKVAANSSGKMKNITSRHLRILALLTTGFCLSMFYRVTNAVIAFDLLRDLNLNAETLGLLGGAFFYSFALVQVPLGLLLDRIGPRIVITVFTALGGVGAILFGLAGGWYMALFGRVLLGMGMASSLMGTLKVLVLEFPPGRFSTLSGIVIAIGTLGSIAATSPLAYLNATIGWRYTFLLAGTITILLAFLIFIFLGENKERADETASPTVTGQETGILRSMVLVIRTFAFWQLGALTFFRYGTFVALQGLWLGPYLMTQKNFSPVKAGNIIMMLAVGMSVGSFVAGYAADRVFRSPKSTLVAGMSLYALLLLSLTGIWDLRSPILFSVIFFLMGLTNGAGMLAYAHVKQLFPLAMAGTVIAAVNFFVMAGGALFTQATGMIIEFYSHSGPAELSYAYHLSFFICFLGMAGSVIFYSFAKGAKGAT
jgi:MFS family permease